MDKFLIPPDKGHKPTEPTAGGKSKRPRENNTPPEQKNQAKRFNANPKQGPATSNRFEGLTVDEPELEPFQIATKKKVVGNTPPIVIELQGEWTLEKVRDTIKKYIKDAFYIQYKGRMLVRVQCYSSKSHQQLKDALVNENVAFHTYTRKDERSPKVVIKGLPKYTQSCISEELSSLGFPGATVTELKTIHHSECPPILVNLPGGTNMSKFKQIRYLSNCVVDIQKYKPNNKPGTQCFRCQGFGHASRNCNRQARCVKCTGSHPTWECTKKNRETPACCCNCQEEHPANYTHCPERLKYLQRIETRRQAIRKSNLTPVTIPSDITGQKTWAQVTAANKKPQSSIMKQLPQDFSKIPIPRAPVSFDAELHMNRVPAEILLTGTTNEKSCSDPQTSEMLEILTTLQEIKQEFKNCKTFIEKVILILKYLGHYVS